MKATASRNRDREQASLYETDFHLWTQRTAALLRAGRFAALDIEHAAEEIDDMGKREVKELNSRLRVLLLHLLKWQCQPRKRLRSWAATIAEQRDAIADSLEQSPSLRQHLSDNLSESYRRACVARRLRPGLHHGSFRPAARTPFEQLLDEEFLPE